MEYQEVNGDLIKLALEGSFDVITHGCNCFCTMGAGIAPLMAKAFSCNKFNLELTEKGNINKLGQIDFIVYLTTNPNQTIKNDSAYKELYVVNSYTQFHFGSQYGTPLDYEALALCLRKINYKFKYQHIGLPQIGCGLAGGNWDRVKKIIQKELKDMKVTVVIYKP